MDFRAARDGIAGGVIVGIGVGLGLLTVALLVLGAVALGTLVGGWT